MLHKFVILEGQRPETLEYTRRDVKKQSQFENKLSVHAGTTSQTR